MGAIPRSGAAQPRDTGSRLGLGGRPESALAGPDTVTRPPGDLCAALLARTLLCWWLVNVLKSLSLARHRGTVIVTQCRRGAAGRRVCRAAWTGRPGSFKSRSSRTSRWWPNAGPTNLKAPAVSPCVPPPA